MTPAAAYSTACPHCVVVVRDDNADTLMVLQALRLLNAVPLHVLTFGQWLRTAISAQSLLYVKANGEAIYLNNAAEQAALRRQVALV